MPLEAVVFDFDGVILDTESAEFAGWEHTFRHYGTFLDPAEWAKCVGTGPLGFSVTDHLQSLVPTADHREAERLACSVRDNLIRDLQPRPGVDKLISDLQCHGVPVGIASSSRAVWVNGLLGHLGWARRFKVVHNRDTVGSTKPNPASYLAACRDLGADPALTVAIEDSTNGLKAALAAGMVAVVVPNPVTKGYDFTGAHVRLESLEQTSKAALDDLVAQCISGIQSP